MIAVDAYVQDVAACEACTSASSAADSAASAGGISEVGVEMVGNREAQELNSDSASDNVDDFTPRMNNHPDGEGQGLGGKGQRKPDVWVRSLFAQVVEHTYDFHQSNPHQSNPHQRTSPAPMSANHTHSATNAATGSTGVYGSTSTSSVSICGEKTIMAGQLRGLILLVLEGLLRVVMTVPSNNDNTTIARLVQLLLNLLGYNDMGCDIKGGMKSGSGSGLGQQPPRPLQGCGVVVDCLGKEVWSVMGMVALVCTDHVLSSSSSSSSSTTNSDAITSLVALSKVLLVDMQLMQHLVILQHGGTLAHHSNHHSQHRNNNHININSNSNDNNDSDNDGFGNNATSTAASSPIDALQLLLPQAPGIILQGVLRWMTGSGAELSSSSSSSASSSSLSSLLSSSGLPIVDGVSPISRAHLVTMAVSLLLSYTFEIVPFEAAAGAALLSVTNDSPGSDIDAMVVCPSDDHPVVAVAAADAFGNSSVTTVGGNIGGGGGSIGGAVTGGVVMDCGDVMELVTLCHQICLDEGIYRNHLTGGDALGRRAAMLLHLWVIERSPQHAPCAASQLWPKRLIKDALVVLGQIYAVLYHFPMTGTCNQPSHAPFHAPSHAPAQTLTWAPSNTPRNQSF